METAKNIIFTILGHTDLRISLSKAKFDAEADFDVRLAVGRRKPRLLGEKQNFRSANFAEKICSTKIFRRKLDFRRFGVVFGEPRPNGRQNQLPRQILL